MTNADRRTTVHRYVVASVLACAMGCASHHIPAALRGYAIVVDGRDEDSNELARALQAYGISVRRNVRGGSGPTAALIHFTFGLPAPGEATFYHVRLADTRSGVIVRAGTIQLDSLTTNPRARASAAVRALMAGDSAFVSP